MIEDNRARKISKTLLGGTALLGIASLYYLNQEHQRPAVSSASVESSHSALPSPTVEVATAQNTPLQAARGAHFPSATATTPGTQIQRTPTERATLRAASPAGRLASGKVLASRERPQANGTLKREKLLEIGGKAPYVVLTGDVPSGLTSAADEELLRQSARVADHILVSAAPGTDEATFRRIVSARGLVVENRVSSDGPYVVSVPGEPTIDGAPEAIAKLSDEAAVGYAEPDYLVFSAHLPGATVRLEEVDGKLVQAGTSAPAVVPSPEPGGMWGEAEMAAASGIRLAALPSGARIIGFDTPKLPTGNGFYNPQLEEQFFLIRMQDGVSVGQNTQSNSANNGTNTVGSNGNLTISHVQGLPFTILSIDIAEYSATLTGQAPLFIGHKADGTTVQFGAGFDGKIDGPGKNPDFQTHTFPASFTNLTKVTVGQAMFNFDNVAVLVEGQEAPPIAAPAPPLIYDVTWDEPKHTLDAVISVGGAYAPSSLYFGTPRVKSFVGALTGPVVEFNSSNNQFHLFVKRNVSLYRVECDLYLDIPDHIGLAIGFNGVTAPYSLYARFMGTGYIHMEKDGSTSPPQVGPFAIRQKRRVAMELNTTSSIWKTWVDGALVHTMAYTPSGRDLDSISFASNLPFNGSTVGIDNIKVYAYGSDTAPAVGPRVAISASEIKFGDLAITGSKTLQVRVSNTGTSQLNITGLSTTNSAFTLPGAGPKSLAPGESYLLSVQFAPATGGTHSGELRINSNDTGRPIATLPLSGKGLGAPTAQLSPASLEVTMLANTIGTRTFTLSNAGVGGLNWQVALAPSSGSTPPPTTPSDTQFGLQWALKTPGGGQGGIDMPNAWSVTTGGPAPVVAVVDSGVDYTHPELSFHTYVNYGEIAGNSIDDDENGLVDDVRGWDFANADNAPLDDSGHGTHVAGIISARGNNGAGVSGVTWGTVILPVKFLSDKGYGLTSDAVTALHYARNIARVINLSWGGGEFSQALYDAIQFGGFHGTLYVAAAGNVGTNNDTTSFYPAGFDLPCIVAVASTTENDGLSYFSNSGVASVDLGAPGSNILGLAPGNAYAYSSGTSMAAPHVSGVAALLFSHNVSMDPAVARELLLFGAEPLASLSGVVGAGGRLNAFRSLRSVVPAWLSPQVTSGVVAAGSSVQIPLTVNTNGLPSGTYTKIVQVATNDPARPSITLPVNLLVRQSSGFAQWTLGSFATDNMLSHDTETILWSASADPDRDGVNNLFEYYTGGDPAKAALVPPLGTPGGPGRTFQYQIRNNLPAGACVVEWTNNLAAPTWRRDLLNVIENTTSGMPPGVSKVTVQITGNVPDDVFFRLSGISE